MDLKQVILQLCSFKNEQEWFEFKENWYQPDTLGEYVSALSNAAAFHLKKYAYFVWGINDETHEFVGTTFDQYCEYNHEPYQHYLSRNLTPSINFMFEEVILDGKRIVVLIIPAAKDIPTAFKDKRYLRIGSAKCNMKDYPKREIELFKILDGRIETLETKPSKYQDLSFNKLFGYYGSKGIILNQKTFIKNLGLKNEDGEFNLLAQLLSDNSYFPLRVSIFAGEEKSSPLISVREFGYNCLLYTLDELLRYVDVLNLIQTDEQNRVVERKEVALFDNQAYREAIVNAILHNKWVEGNEPMISIFSNRIEILSRGGLPQGQTLEGFFLGESIPVNERLSQIFLQLHISEKSGRGVPLITSKYGKEAFSFHENSIVVTIPFTRVDNKKDNEPKSNKKILNSRREKIVSLMKENPYITTSDLTNILEISETAVENNISYLRNNGFIKRFGSRKNGYWKTI